MRLSRNAKAHDETGSIVLKAAMKYGLILDNKVVEVYSGKVVDEYYPHQTVPKYRYDVLCNTSKGKVFIEIDRTVNTLRKSEKMEFIRGSKLNVIRYKVPYNPAYAASCVMFGGETLSVR